MFHCLLVLEVKDQSRGEGLLCPQSAEKQSGGEGTEAGIEDNQGEGRSLGCQSITQGF